MNTLLRKSEKVTSRRAVAPVIATLLLVAIAVVGGSIVFVFAQGFFSSAQVSGSPSIESLKIIGYDARDTDFLQLHDGADTDPTAMGASSNGLLAGERIAVYVKNDSVQKVTLNEVRYAGTVYVYKASAGTLDAFGATSFMTDAANPATFTIATKGPDTASTTSSAELQPGQQATIILQLGENIKTGRDTQFKLSTSNGAVFVGTVVAGQQSG